MIGFAVLFGLLAVFVAQSWLTNQTEQRMKDLEAQRKPLVTQTIVVASRPLRFGNDLSKTSLREIAWPADALPVGSFAKVEELLTGDKRVVLTSIEANEPILSSKITGAGQRATLSAVLKEGMKAVTIRVNDVEGVAGFVLPGDRVDIALTRQLEKGVANTDVVLQSVKVLAIDQLADERADKPSLVKAVTLEVDTPNSQKLALAGTVGTLSLALRKAGDTGSEATRRVTITDLSTHTEPKGPEARFVNIGVIRASAAKQIYSVPIERNADAQALVSGETRPRERQQ
jgi:pilus assembly protein CpaB